MLDAPLFRRIFMTAGRRERIGQSIAQCIAQCKAQFIFQCIAILLLNLPAQSLAEQLQVGAAVVNINPAEMPVLVNGGMNSRAAKEIKTTINARAIVVTDGVERIAIVVVDSCMVPKDLLDDAKAMAAKRTGIPADRILVSATHTHTAPSSIAILGTEADPNYIPLLRRKIVDAIVDANENLQPAQVGWGSANAEQFTALRRWIRRPDRVDVDPFGNRTVRANMHAARVPEDVTGESGPEDPELSMIAFRSLSGEPIAILCNFSMHYFGDQPISADYFGLFSEGIAQHATNQHQALRPGQSSVQSNGPAKCIGIMSHGCSGDAWRRDYMSWSGKETSDINGYTQGLLEIAKSAYASIVFDDEADIQMAETRLPLNYRLPDQQRLEWARRIVDTIEGDLPKTREQVYAREQLLLHEMQSTEVVVQALRIGKIAIATTPNETYALTGLKLKLQSPVKHTMVIELANGADGYIPPPEQHLLGGYNTWAARSAGLEEQAEPKIVAAALNLLEKVSGESRRPLLQTVGPAAKRILENKPLAYYRLDEMEASAAVDRSGNHRDGIYENGIVFFLEGPKTNLFEEAFSAEANRCIHTAGGRVRLRLPSLGESYTLELSFYNGMPNDARETTGWLYSRDHSHGITKRGEHLGIGGTKNDPGRLVYQMGDATIVGNTEIKRWTWNHVKLVRKRNRVTVFLNGSRDHEIDAVAEPAARIETCFLGGRSDNDSNWEGRLDEVAFYTTP